MRYLFKDYVLDTDRRELRHGAGVVTFAPQESGSNVDQPSNDSGEVSIAGKNYVVLRNVRGIMAVYRVRNDGALKRLKRWPEGLN